MKLAITYAALAAVATAFNIFTQDLTLRLYDGQYQLLLSVLAGTMTGLIVKYYLDKRFIFQFRAKSAVHDGITFTLYAAMGLVTTAIFWATEFSFHFLFETNNMRYLGGAIGLATGYIVKYKLDKRFVFKDASA